MGYNQDMFLDILFQLWRRMSGTVQWRLLWLVSSKFMICTAGVVFDPSGRVLLQRHRHWVPDVWGLPGGIVHTGERLEEAFAREVKEETELAVEEVRLLRLNSGFKLRLEAYFTARVGEGAAEGIRLQKQEVLEARFFSLEELPEKLLPVQRGVIEEAGGIRS